jgi:hypothetical protein
VRFEQKVYTSEIKKGKEYTYLPCYYGHIESITERLRRDLSPLDSVRNLDILITALIRHCSFHTFVEMLHANKRNVIAAWR